MIRSETTKTFYIAYNGKLLNSFMFYKNISSYTFVNIKVYTIFLHWNNIQDFLLKKSYQSEPYMKESNPNPKTRNQPGTKKIALNPS